MIAFLLAAAIQLSGVTGDNLRARAFFDVNNVKVGDPLVLTIDFIGRADFRNIHPPALSRMVSRVDWKVDDVSAKTDTFNDARRLTYRVRPLRDGVLWFPALEFAYADANGAAKLVKSNEIPVHAKVGEQVVVTEEMKAEAAVVDEAPQLELITEAPQGLSDDLLFAWRKALANPSADAFAAFDFTAAKLNEATCAVNAGNWARAMKVYSALEWRTGQTTEIERGITAAMALKTDNPAAELPVWRQVLRPLLRFAWKGRVGIVLGVLLAFFLLGWLLGRGIRAVACVAIMSFSLNLAAETIETVTTNADGSVTTTKIVRKGGMTFQTTSTVGGTAKAGGFEPFDLFDDPFGRRRADARGKVEITSKLVTSKPQVAIGEPFELLLSVEHPRTVELASSPRVSIGEQDFITVIGSGRILPAERSANPTNIIRRFAFPVRANVYFPGPLHYSTEVDYFFAGDHPFFRTVRTATSGVKSARLEVRPFPVEGRSPDFGGVVARRLDLFEMCDRLAVETNDVVTITYRMRVSDGFVPADYLPKDAAFEWGRRMNVNGAAEEIEYKRYFVADGSQVTPTFSIPFYNPVTKAYDVTKVGGTALKYGIIETNGLKGQR